MKPPLEYRPRFNALKGTDPIAREDIMAQPESGTTVNAKLLGRMKNALASKQVLGGDPAYILAHKRALKAAAQRRYRAKKAGK